MILVDTSVWIDHFRQTDAALVTALDRLDVLAHPVVIGELAMGNFRQRAMILHDLAILPRGTVATDQEVLTLVDRHGLLGLGWAISTRTSWHRRCWAGNRLMDARPAAAGGGGAVGRRRRRDLTAAGWIAPGSPPPPD